MRLKTFAQFDGTWEEYKKYLHKAKKLNEKLDKYTPKDPAQRSFYETEREQE